MHGFAGGTHRCIDPQTGWASSPMVTSGVDVARCFEIDTFKRQFCLYCDTEEDAVAWVEKVRALLPRGAWHQVGG